MYRLAFTAGLFLLSGNALAALTETKACDTCDYDDAVRIAKLYYEQPNCQVSGLNGGELDQFGVTTYQCNTTSKEIIVTNALERTAYKFVITAEQQSQHSAALRITARDTGLSRVERDALQEFYDIDSQFRRAVREAGTIITPPSISSSLQSYNLKGLDNAVLSSTSSGSGTEDCSNHPSFYLTSLAAQRSIEAEMTQQITDRIGDESWNDFFEDTDFTGGSIQISDSGGGLSVSLSHDEIGAFAVKVYGNNINNALSFRVSYGGEAEIDDQRRLLLSFELDRGASRFDGIAAANFMSGGEINMANTVVSNCLFENLARIPGATIENIGGSGGSGNTGGGGSGFLVFGGGSGNCGRRIKYTSCSVADGVRVCTENSLVLACGRN